MANEPCKIFQIAEWENKELPLHLSTVVKWKYITYELVLKKTLLTVFTIASSYGEHLHDRDFNI